MGQSSCNCTPSTNHDSYVSCSRIRAMANFFCPAPSLTYESWEGIHRIHKDAREYIRITCTSKRSARYFPGTLLFPFSTPFHVYYHSQRFGFVSSRFISSLGRWKAVEYGQRRWLGLYNAFCDPLRWCILWQHCSPSQYRKLAECGDDGVSLDSSCEEKNRMLGQLRRTSAYVSTQHLASRIRGQGLE